MRLKKIELLGFKSFADKVELLFEEGVTGIVGPNGCGKSNISDAVRWVLGEQSAKSIRGSKMADVIFAGTSTRKALSMAEVTLTLSEVDGALPTEFDEVSVTRRIYKTGDSEYLINRKPVRLRDVHSLFLDSGIGKSAFSIFEQGKIDQVIHWSPLDRRRIFEEAAGILRFLQRKKEALRRMESTDTNIDRLSDIHKEVERQIEVLEKQAEKARKYKEQKHELERLEKLIFVLRWKLFDDRVQNLTERRNQAESDISKRSEKLGEARESGVKQKALVDELEERYLSESESIYKRGSEKEIKVREQLATKERLEEIQKKESRFLDEQEQLKGLIDGYQERQTEKKELKEAASEKLKVRQDTLSQVTDATSSMEEAVQALRESGAKAQKERLEAIEAKHLAEKQLQANALQKESFDGELGKLEKETGSSFEEVKKLEEELKEKQHHLREQTEVVDQERLKIKQIEAAEKELKSAIENQVKQIGDLERLIHQDEARHKVLLSLRDAFEGFSKGTQKLLKASKDPKSPLHNKLRAVFELVSSYEGLETAAALSMRPYVGTLAVATKADFELVQTYMADHGIEEGSLICLELLSAVPTTSREGDALLKGEHQDPLLSHFLSRVSVKESLEEAFKAAKTHPGWEFCCEDGTFLDARSVVFKGYASDDNIFLREAEIKELKKRIPQRKKELETGKVALSDAQETMIAKGKTRRELDEKVRRIEMSLVEVNFSVQRMEGDLQEKVKRQKMAYERLKVVKARLEELKEEATKFEEELQVATKTSKEREEALLAFELQLQEKVTALEEQRLSQKTRASEVQGLLDEVGALSHELHLLDVKRQESESRLKRLTEEHAQGEEMRKVLAKKQEECMKEIEMAGKELDRASTSLATLREKLEKAKSRVVEADKDIQKREEALRKIESEHARLEAKVGELVNSRSLVEEELLEFHELSIQEGCQLFQDEKVSKEGLETAEKRARSLRQQISAAGDINMTSIEECATHQKRYEELTGQLGDLTGSKDELLKMIKELDSESRSIFKKTFDEVNENFKKNFSLLFEGGEAELCFTESNDILEAGIEITAKPPGKQMRSINLLSGGEKCLTAMALLFAVFEVKPSPFCMLDEIDAPLDDTNIERFVRMLKQFIDRCQFIIVTHNKRTMAIADKLFGVSMEEKGVSKLLSMSFSEAKEQRTPELVGAG